MYWIFKLLHVCISTHLWVDRGTPSLLHSTITVEDGGGLTLQGSTTVCPTKASTVGGSDLSIVTPSRVKLRKDEGKHRRKEWRKWENEQELEKKVKKQSEDWKEENSEEESLYALLLVLVLLVTKASIKIAHNLASAVQQNKHREERNPALAQTTWKVMRQTMQDSPTKQQIQTKQHTTTTKINCDADTRGDKGWFYFHHTAQSKCPTRAKCPPKKSESEDVANTHNYAQERWRKTRYTDMKHHSRTFISLIDIRVKTQRRQWLTQWGNRHTNKTTNINSSQTVKSPRSIKQVRCQFKVAVRLSTSPEVKNEDARCDYLSKRESLWS